MSVVALVLAAYLLGSIPTSLLVARWARGIDLRDWGSGNLGATNLYRAAGAGLASIALVVDVGKGFVPAWFFHSLDGVDAPYLALAYGATAVLGHIFSVWVKFRGGKGVATGAGMYLALAPAAAASALIAWIAIVAATRIASLASLAAATLLPALVWLFRGRSDPVFWATLPLAALVWWTHRSNIARLWAHRERTVARHSADPAPEPDRTPRGA